MCCIVYYCHDFVSKIQFLLYDYFPHLEKNIFLSIPLTVTQATTGQEGFVIYNFILNILSMVFVNFPSNSAIVDLFLTYFFLMMFLIRKDHNKCIYEHFYQSASSLNSLMLLVVCPALPACHFTSKLHMRTYSCTASAQVPWQLQALAGI